MKIDRAMAQLLEVGLGLLEPLAGDRTWLCALRGRALVDGGEHERAILYLHTRLDHHPDAPWLHFHAGRAAQAKGLAGQARHRFAHAAALDPEEPTFRFALGHALRQEGHLDAAAREFEIALLAVPGDPRILFHLGVVERERGRSEAAQKCFEAVVARWPRDVGAWYTLGVCAYEQRDLYRSRRALERALSLDRKHHKAWYQSALIHLEEQEVAAGRTALRTALRLQPSYAPAHYALARTFLEEDPNRARHHLREALLGHPPVLRAHLDLGRLYEQAGQWEKARSEYLLFRRHFPEKRPDWIAGRLSAIDAMLATTGRPPPVPPEAFEVPG